MKIYIVLIFIVTQHRYEEFWLDSVYDNENDANKRICEIKAGENLHGMIKDYYDTSLRNTFFAEIHPRIDEREIGSTLEANDKKWHSPSSRIWDY